LANKRESLRAGLDAEKAVEAFLRSEGWSILGHRWRGAGGELDLVALKEGQLRFVEVKYRQADDPVGLEAIDGRKFKKLERAAEAFLQDFQDFEEVCFAVAYVLRGERGWQIEFLDDPR
jgi:putative endonuclease